jgi:Holliday junction DNA helicase RuvA
MFAFLKGFIFEINNTEKTIVIDTGNVGYNVLIPTPSDFSEEEEVFLYTHIVFAETDQRIFGFKHKIELKIFKQLIQVSGVGPKTALEVIATFPEKSFVDIMLEPHDIAIKKIMKVKGIGKKSAETLLISVKEKLILLNNTQTLIKSGDKKPESDIPELIIQALVNLGYSKKELIKNSSHWFNSEQSHENNIKNYLHWSKNK